MLYYITEFGNGKWRIRYAKKDFGAWIGLMVRWHLTMEWLKTANLREFSENNSWRFLR